MISRGEKSMICICGGVAEWTKAAVLKTANPSGFVGSNPTPSAKTSQKPRLDTIDIRRTKAIEVSKWNRKQSS